MNDDLFDCIVIGAGPAGLSAWLFLARYRRKVLTLHNKGPRNIYSQGIHGFLGHGIPPAELLARRTEEVRIHGGRIIEGAVTPASHHRLVRHLQHIGDLLNSQATKETHLDHLAFSPIHCGQRRQRSSSATKLALRHPEKAAASPSETCSAQPQR